MPREVLFVIAAIIAECNPPHTGHAHLISKVRRRFGDDTCVLVLLGGNYVQRGDLAFTDRYRRAAGAVSIGADLVLELPFPYSCQTAQIYATSAVTLLQSLAGVDALCFGSESGNIDTLKEIASYLSSTDFQRASASEREENPHKSYAQIRTDLIRSTLSPVAAEQASLPNNILAIEYLLALQALASPIEPYTIERQGAYHSDDCVARGFMSAGAIRQAIRQDGVSNIKPYITAEFAHVLQDDLQKGMAPADMERLSSVMLTHLRRICTEQDLSVYFDIDAALAAKMKAALNKATNIQTFISLLKAKHMTEAHLRRALLNAYFGVTSSDVHSAPAFTRLLASNTRGKESLKYLKQHSSLPILSRPSDVRHIIDAQTRKAVELADFADSLYFLSVPTPQPVEKLYGFRPFIAE